MLKPFPYQQKLIDEVIDVFKSGEDRVCLQAMTSAGKTVIFSFLIDWYLKSFPDTYPNCNVLILAHREELVTQAEETLTEVGIGSEVVTAGVRRLKHHSRVYVGMIETVNNRMRNNNHYIPRVGLLICDEAHILVYNKVFDYFKGAKIMGCTATPVVMKRETFWKCKYCRSEHISEAECCEEPAEEWTRPVPLSRIYHNIVVGPQPSELIEFGSIVQDVSLIKHYTDDTALRTDADGEYIPETVDKEYGSSNAAFNVILNYEELCKGLKTLIFNNSAKSNLVIYDKFISAGYTNVRMYDSVNAEQSGSRAQLLKWFAETPDAILLNVGVFTTGFNSREVEAIIVNRPIGSLALYLQIAGRGARSSKIIYKDRYIHVDGGGNVDRFGEPSIDRDWSTLFHEGNGKPRAKKINAIDVHDCPECGALYAKSEPSCPECGFTISPPSPSELPKKHTPDSDEVMKPIRAIPPPNGKKIHAYTVSRGEDINFAFKIMIGQLVDMYKYYRVTPEQYETALLNGEIDKKTMDMIRRVYFVLTKQSDIATPGKRTLAELLKRTKKEIKKYYESRGKQNTTGRSHELPTVVLS